MNNFLNTLTQYFNTSLLGLSLVPECDYNIEVTETIIGTTFDNKPIISRVERHIPDNKEYPTMCVYYVD